MRIFYDIVCPFLLYFQYFQIMSIFTLSLFCEIIGWCNKNQTIGHCWSKMPNISQVSVATCLTCGTIFNDNKCIANDWLSLVWKWKNFERHHSAKITRKLTFRHRLDLHRPIVRFWVIVYIGNYCCVCWSSSSTENKSFFLDKMITGSLLTTP